MVASAHEILKIVYHVLKDKSDYVELGENYVDDRGKASQIKYHKEALKNPGVDLPDTQSA